MSYSKFIINEFSFANERTIATYSADSRKLTTKFIDGPKDKEEGRINLLSAMESAAVAGDIALLDELTTKLHNQHSGFLAPNLNLPYLTKREKSAKNQ